MKNLPSRNLIMASAIAGALALAGCGGGGGTSASTEGSPITISGAVMDGYLVNAKVCLDTNANAKCDAGEPNDTTKAAGVYSLSVSAADAAKYSIVAEVTAGLTSDEDTGVSVAKSYVLMAPPGAQSSTGKVYVTPLTTLVQNAIAQVPGLTAAEAENLVKSNLGYTPDMAVSLFENYMTGANAEAMRLHQIAQVLARVIAANKEALETAAKQAGLTPLSNTIVQMAVSDAVSQLEKIQAVADEGANFNTQGVINSETGIKAAMSSAGVVATYDSSTVQTEIENAQFMAGATASDALAALKDGQTTFWVNPTYNNGITGYQLNRSFTQANSAGTQTTSREERYIPGTDPATAAGWKIDTSDRISLANGSWQRFPNSGGGCNLQPKSDGSVNFACADGDAGNVRFNTLDISGRSVAEFTDPPEAKPAFKAATFGTGAKAYQSTFVLSADRYEIGVWESCGGGVPVNGNCNLVTGYNQQGVSTGVITTLSGLLQVTDTGLIYIGNGYQQFSVVFNGTNKAGAVGDSGTATFYTGPFGSQSTILPIAGTWKVVSVDGQTLLMLAVPPAYKTWAWSRGSDSLFFAVQDGVVRRGQLKQKGVPMLGDWRFNSIAAQDMLNAFDLAKAAP